MFSKGSKPNEEVSVEPPKMKTSNMPSIVSAGLQVTGNMTSDGDIQIEGTIVGDVKSRTVTIGLDGLVKGQVTAEIAQVSGSVEGKVRAKTIVVVASARILGDIIHDVLTVEPGAHVEGALKRYSKPEAVRVETRPNGAGKETPDVKPVPGAKVEPVTAIGSKSGRPN